MTAAIDPPDDPPDGPPAGPPAGPPDGAGAGGWLRFIERRCGASIAAALADAGPRDGDEGAAGPPVLSLAELDLAIDTPDVAEHEHLAVLALGLGGAAGAPADRFVLRFITPSTMRSAGRAHGSRWLVNDVVIATPARLDEVSLLIYRVRRTPRVERVLGAIEDMVEALEAAGDDRDQALGRAALDRLEVLDDAAEAEVVLSGHRLRFDGAAPPGGERYLAVVAAGPDAPATGRLWLIDHELHEGPDRASAAPVGGRPHALLRLGARPTRQSVREFIAEIRRRHQRRPGEPTAGDQGESFASFVSRQVEQRRRALIEATFGHHNMLPVVTPIALEAAANLAATVELRAAPPSRFQQLIDEMRVGIRASLGLQVPGIRIRINDTDLPAGTYIVMLDEIPLVSGSLDPDRLLCLADPDALASASFEGEWHLRLERAAVPDGSGRAACWLPAERGEQARKAGIETWDAARYIMEHLRSVVIANLELFANLDELVRLLHEVDPSDDLLGRIRGARGGLPRFAEAARALLMEGLPIQPIAALAERYLAVASAVGPPDEIVEELRRLPALRARLTRDVAEWRLLVLDDDFQATIREGIRREGDAAVLALEPEVVQAMLTAVRDELGSPVAGQRTVLAVDDWRLRPFVRSLLAIELPQVRVVARRELEGLAALPAPAATLSVRS